jgi:hydroxypyruvate reductase
METFDLRARALDIFMAAVEAVHPQELLEEALTLQGTVLTVEGVDGSRLDVDLNGIRQAVAVGAGKATAPMAKALEDLLEDRLDGGVISVKYGHGLPLDRIAVREAGHPIPDASGLAATAEIVELLSGLGEEDLAFVLLSGGGSALLDAYPETISLAEAQETFDVLLRCGAPIHEMNTVRKHISLVKGGQLARIASPARVISLVLSDVIGDPLPIIASGPTVPDPSTFDEALMVLDRRGGRDRIPTAVRTHLEEGAAGEIPETPKPGSEDWDRCATILVGNNGRAVEAAADRARSLGLHPHILTTRMEGEASQVGQDLARMLIHNASTGDPLEPPFCLVSGGETTVTVEGEPGKGGRSQELAVAAAIELTGKDRLVVLAGGTDGTDGPTDAAGGVVDGMTVKRGEEAGLSAQTHLDGHDAYPFLEATEGLIRIGPTMTNVMDLVLLLALPSEGGTESA